MAADTNHIVLIGRLTRDPELRALPSGTSVCSIRLAFSERYKESGGDWTERANYVDVTVWGAQGENCAKYLSKGRQICVDGRLRWREWESDGGKRQAHDVVANSVQFLSDGGGNKGHDSDIPYDDPVPAGVVAQDDDDVPF